MHYIDQPIVPNKEINSLKPCQGCLQIVFHRCSVLLTPQRTSSRRANIKGSVLSAQQFPQIGFQIDCSFDLAASISHSLHRFEPTFRQTNIRYTNLVHMEVAFLPLFNKFFFASSSLAGLSSCALSFSFLVFSFLVLPLVFLLPSFLCFLSFFLLFSYMFPN